ncbi:unnamed protein product [Larinioides sclopetarius]|uniref:LisH domain-containing protein n=1 Tax=Larinioides sclopetarius TaxID=280406 RepID=A0AAV2BXA5_9ARAC
MEERDLEYLDPAGLPDIISTLEIEIKDFVSPTKSVHMEITKSIQDFRIHFFLDVFPNEFDKDSREGWVVAIPSLEVESRYEIHDKFISWTLSVIDAEGNPRLPISFQVDCAKRHRDADYYRFPKYLKRSFFLNRADEFLPKGVLTLRCDIFSARNGEIRQPNFFRYEERKLLKTFKDFYHSIPQAVYSKFCDNGPRGEFIVFDFTSQVLALPQFHETRKRFGVYGIPPTLPSISSDSKADSKGILDHIWIFDTHPDRFLLSLDERQDSVGVRLLKTSPIIRQCVNVPLKERAEKRIRIPKTSSRTFKIVLFFLEKGMIPTSRYRDFLHLYKFSHLHEMKDLQQKCAKYWVRCSKIESNYKEVEEIARVYSDEYLSALLYSSVKQSFEEIQKYLEPVHSFKEMKFEDSEDIIESTYDTTLEIKIPRIRTDEWIVKRSEPIKDRYSISNVEVIFSASVYTNRVELRSFHRRNENTDGEKNGKWLEFLPSVFGGNYRFRPGDPSILSCTVSVIDIEGNSRCPKTFQNNLSEGDGAHSKYQEISYFLERVDELLPRGVLTLRCEFSFHFSPRKEVTNDIVDFLSSIPRSGAFNNRAEIEHPCDGFTLYDFTFRIVTLPLFHESRMRFGVHGVPPALPSTCSDSEENSTDTMTDVWIFDTPFSRFLLDLDERQDSIGVRLLKASPVIRRMVNTAMKERREKRILFPDIEDWTFKLVLYFLEKKAFPTSTSREFMNVYKFSHEYLMEEMNQKSAEELTKSLKSSNDLEMLEEFVNFYSDEYLSTLFESRRQEFEDLQQSRLRLVDIPYSDCYA